MKFKGKNNNNNNNNKKKQSIHTKKNRRGNAQETHLYAANLKRKYENAIPFLFFLHSDFP